MATVLAFAASLHAQSSLLDILSDELNREFTILQKQEVSPYFLEYRASDIHSITLTGSFGSLTDLMKNKYRVLFTSIKVGDYSFDNNHPSENGNDRYGGSRMQSTQLPLENNEVAIRQKIWRLTDMNYKSAVSSYQNLLTNSKKRNSIPDFSKENPHQHEDPPMEDLIRQFDQQEWESKLKEYSGVFLRDRVFIDGEAVLNFSTERKYYVSTEGSRIAQNHTSATLILSVSILAEDGDVIPLEKVFHARIPEELPSSDSVILACQTLVKDLRKLSTAPKAEPYSGPAILSAAASGVFFHEIFGHRIEGHRLKSKSDGQTFKTRIGEPVLNKNLSVISDPTLSDYNGNYLNGYYAYDEQGIPGQKVTVVEDGVLKNFLMSRQPLEADSRSNGHGRANASSEAVSRQSNLIVSAKKTRSEEQLKKSLLQKCRKLGLDYGYYIEEVSGGFTTTDRYQPNVFNIQPRKVFRIYTDGRADELVRGVTLIGTPLVMFSGIEAAGDQMGIFNGTCGAESGGIPVSTISPSLLISRIETQKEPEGNQIKPILEMPGGMKSSAISPPPDNLIEQALIDEMNRNLEQLKYNDFDNPFFISYSLSNHQIYTGSATLGSMERSEIQKFSTNNVRLMVGNYELNDENYTDQSITDNYYSSYITPPLESDYMGIRRSFWKMTDQVYKSAGNLYKNKKKTLSTTNLPAGYEPIPDFSREEVTLKVIERKTPGMDTTGLDKMLRLYSNILLDYKEVTGSNVSMNMHQSDHFFVNSEGARIQYPQDHSTLMIQVQCFGKDYQPLFSVLTYNATTPATLPSRETVEREVRSMVDSLLLVRNAPVINDRYYGPVLFLGRAASSTLESMLTGSASYLTATRESLIKDQQMNLYSSSMMNGTAPSLNQRVMPKNINITSRTHMEQYQDTELTGNFEVDAEGIVPPAELLLVKNGILVNQLNGRTPTRDIPHSNGHMRGSLYGGKMIAPGILDMEVTEGAMNKAELKQKLISLAKEENLDYAYILRSISGNGIPLPLLLYKVDLDNGDESLVRIISTIDLSENSLREISDYSSERVVHNTQIGGGLTLSLIIPDAYIVEDVTLSPIFSPISISAPVVPN